MVLFFLYISAECEGIASLELKDSENICIDVVNPLSDFERRDKVVLNPSATVEQDSGSREAEYHFSLSWEGAKKMSTLRVLNPAQVKTLLKKKKGVEAPRSYKQNDSGEFVPIFAVECRSLEPTGFHPMGQEFRVVSDGGVVFDTDVDLSEGDWADYDGDNDQPISVSVVKFKWESV